MPLKDTFNTTEPLVVTVVAGEVLEEFILDACFWNGVGKAEESCRGWIS